MSSQAYTPGLKRKALCRVKKTRKLPIAGEVLIEKGDFVSFDTIVARTEVPGEPYVVKVSFIIEVEPEEIMEFMCKKVGETIEKNEMLAYRKFLFIKKLCKSPIKGTVEHISEVTGRVILRGDPIKVELNAYIPGKVVEVIPNEGVTVETYATFIQGIFGIGGETHGKIMIISKNSEDVLTSEQITDECIGGILVGGSLVMAEALHRAVEVGVKGIVVGGIEEKDLIDFIDRDIGVAITGQEQVGLTLIITEGFSKMKMSEKTFNLLKGHDRKIASINGATQLRAGVLRPEILIPLEVPEFTQITKLDETTDFVAEGLTIGTFIRIIREPYFGLLGNVVTLPVELKQIESESKVRVLEIELEDGKKVIVPRANVEIIEE